MRIRELERSEWELFRELRLRALAESPNAFARRFVDERGQPDAHWIRLTESVTMPGGQIMLLAEEDGRSFGLVFGLLDREHPTTGDGARGRRSCARSSTGRVFASWRGSSCGSPKATTAPCASTSGVGSPTPESAIRSPRIRPSASSR